MNNIESNYGGHLKRWVLEWCEGCKCQVDLGPGDLTEDGVIEVRTCEDGHRVETEARYRAPESESTEFGIR
ncbi:hypothetical protein [Arthrobacter woluwensis]|uniref:Uncharacterized protein n=1 Tax=Arthrobacter woluwensis TaxID=156980 RepID=A0A1H4I6D0_9MICC|nr:hypothetical protein [Arthrobacter woluwensis]SEB29654.1 hypothetical protein SAMN04489745_0069 [Arthrobacter woluwensis]